MGRQRDSSALRDSSSPKSGGQQSGHRVASRVDLDAPVRVTLLNGNDTSYAGRFVNASAKGMKITMGNELFVGTTIR